MTKKTKKTRVDLALEFMAANPKATAYAAAKHVGIETSAVYRAIKARNRPRCPTCGQAMPKTK